MSVIGYVRVSTDEQGQSGAGLEVQRQAIVAECTRRGWELLEVIEDAGFSAKDLRRPGIKTALEVLKEGDAKALVAAKLDRLSAVSKTGRARWVNVARRLRRRPESLARRRTRRRSCCARRRCN